MTIATNQLTTTFRANFHVATWMVVLTWPCIAIMTYALTPVIAILDSLVLLAINDIPVSIAAMIHFTTTIFACRIMSDVNFCVC